MRKVILIIEDDIFIRDLLKQLFESEEFEVLTASHGQEGLDYLSKMSTPPHLILLDLMMPIKDGFEFRREQLANGMHSTVPLIALTAEGGTSERKKGLKAYTIVKKPFDIDELVALVKKLLKDDA